MSLWDAIQSSEKMRFKVKCGGCRHFAITKYGTLFCKAHDRLLIPDFEPIDCGDFKAQEEE